MKLTQKLALAAVAAAVVLAYTPNAMAEEVDGISINVTPWIAPNAYGSPSYNQARDNAIYAEMHGLGTYGAAGPTQYNAQSTATSSQVIVTGFPSWMGVADPGGAYANELGNRMLFGLSIVGSGGTQFAISQLSFSASSSDPGNWLGFGFGAGSYNYSSEYVGVLFGDDGKLGGGDDTYITSGPNTQLVNAIFGRGSGSSYAAYCPDSGPCTPEQQQAAIDAAAAYPTTYSFTGTYSLVGTGATGSGTFNIGPDAVSATPEPSSLLLLGTGMLGVAGALRKRILS